MYAIDLLKGQGLPVKTKPQGVAISVITFAVPVIAAIALFGYYLRSTIITAIHKQSIKTCEAKIAGLGDAIKFRQQFETQKSSVNSCLSEVASSIGRHIQWSPILATLVEKMPDSVVLTKLEVRRHSIKKKMPMKSDPRKMVEGSVPVKTLKMSVSGSPESNCDSDVRVFRDHLRRSDVIGPNLEDIVIVSQGFGELGDRDVVSYEIECIFKPEL